MRSPSSFGPPEPLVRSGEEDGEVIVANPDLARPEPLQHGSRSQRAHGARLGQRTTLPRIVGPMYHGRFRQARTGPDAFSATAAPAQQAERLGIDGIGESERDCDDVLAISFVARAGA